MSYLGIDIGTSSVKSVLIDDKQNTLAQSTIPLTISRPLPLYSEQNPEDWWNAVTASITELRKHDAWQNLKTIGLTGQMHGAVCLDKNHKVLCPAILWNDGRSYQESIYLNQQHPEFLTINGNLIVAGFTAPKLLWLKNNQPNLFKQIDKVLLPKDYIRYKLSNVFATDLSDASGTGWIDVKNRCWSEKLINLCDLDITHMPSLYEGTAITGYLNDNLKRDWGLSHEVAIIAGGGDNAAGAISTAITTQNSAMLSLGTSGVYFTASNEYHASPTGAYHSFCHCIPNKWHQMGVILSAASCLSWWSGVCNKSEAELIHQAKNRDNHTNTPIFLPYLSGERTPHNDSLAKSIFWGLNHNVNEADLTNAVLEGVAFASADCQKILPATDNIPAISLIGGGAKSTYWGQILANVLNKPIKYHDESRIGPSFGAALLALIAANQLKIEEAVQEPATITVIEPQQNLVDFYQHKINNYRELYTRIKGLGE